MFVLIVADPHPLLPAMYALFGVGNLLVLTAMHVLVDVVPPPFVAFRVSWWVWCHPLVLPTIYVQNGVVPPIVLPAVYVLIGVVPAPLVACYVYAGWLGAIPLRWLLCVC